MRVRSQPAEDRALPDAGGTRGGAVPLRDSKGLYRLIDDLLTARAESTDTAGLLKLCVQEIFASLRQDMDLAAGLYTERDAKFELVHAVGDATGGLPLSLDPELPALKLLLAQHTILCPEDSAPDRTAEARLLPRFPCAATVVTGVRGRHLLLLVPPAHCDWAAMDALLNTIRTVVGARALQDRWRRSLREAADIQRGLLPERCPEVPGFRIAGRSAPSEEVGGDFYDFYELAGGAFGVSIGDASGHGLPAALVARDVVVGLRMGMDGATKMGQVFARLNRVLHGGVPFSSFVSAFFAEIEADGHVLYVNAGHPPPLRVGRRGAAPLAGGASALGPLPDAPFVRRIARLDEGDLLVLYTDGIVERRRPSGEAFGEERLIRVLRGHTDAPVQVVVDEVFAAAGTFADGAPWDDDATVVVLKRVAGDA